MRIIILATALLGVVFSGCTSQPSVKTSFQKKETTYNVQSDNNPVNFRYQPVIGTKQDDTKTMIDMGQWAKIWVKNYKNSNTTFVATHSIVTMIKEPGFIAGEQVPRSKRDTTYNTYGGKTFTFRSSDLIYDDSSQGSANMSDSEIKDYVNNYEYSKKTQKLNPEDQKRLEKYEEGIKKYIQEKKKTEPIKEAPKEELMVSTSSKLDEYVTKKNEGAKPAEKDEKPYDSVKKIGDKCPEYMTKEECLKGSIK